MTIPDLPIDIAHLAPTTDEQAAMTAFLQRLIATPGTSGKESQVAELVLAELNALGIEDTRVDGAGSILVTLGSGDGPVVVLDSHLDTVHVTGEWERDPHGGVIEDGVVYGLGACDALASLAAMVYAAGRLHALGLPHAGTLALAFVVQGEPCEGCGLRFLLDEADLQPDYVILGEPTAMQVARGQRGRIMFRVTVQGKSTHASQPQEGINAITAAARLVFGLDLLSVDLASDPFLGSGSIAVTRIESDSPSLNAVPNRCTLYIDRRLTLGETPSRAMAELENVVMREGVEVDISVEQYRGISYTGVPIETLEAYNPWTLDSNHPLVRTTAAVVETIRDEQPRIEHCPFSTDGAYTMAELGIPTVAFGPGHPSHAHTINDQVAIDDLHQSAHVYAALAASLLQRTQD